MTNEFEEFLSECSKKYKTLANNVQVPNKKIYYLKLKQYLPRNPYLKLKYVDVTDCKLSSLRLNQLVTLHTTYDLNYLYELINNNMNYKSHWILNDIGLVKCKFNVYVIEDEAGKELYKSTMRNEMLATSLSELLINGGGFKDVENLVVYVKENLVVENEVVENVYFNDVEKRLCVETDKNFAKTDIIDYDGVIYGKRHVYVNYEK